MVYERMVAESKHMDEKIQTLRKQIEKLPDGQLICTKNGKYYKYYIKKNGSTRYLKNAEHELTEALAYKKYLSCKLEDFLNEKNALDAYVKKHISYQEKVPKMLENAGGYQCLLQSFLCESLKNADNWKVENYERNTKHPEQLIHKTLSGNIVRSKSESMIDTSLYLNQIPYRYECALYLDEVCFYPDFTIYNPRTDRIVYWEHFGMMDDPAYAKNAYSKLQIYQAHDIIPTMNLITTFETRQNPLTADEVERTIQHFLM